METQRSHDAMQTNDNAGAAARRTPAHLSRQRFLGRVAGVAAATATAGALGSAPLGTAAASVAADTLPPRAAGRADRAYSIRVSAARAERARPLLAHPTNGDEERYASTRIGNFTKGLAHNALGEVDPATYAALLGALRSGRPADFEAIPLGPAALLFGPQGAYAYVLEGADSGRLATLPPPAFSSAEQAGEMAELYWYALARDVPFARYASNPLIARAAADLSRLSDFRGPKAGGVVTPATIFRGGLAGEMTGPSLSQFLWLPVPNGTWTLDQRYAYPPPNEFLTAYDDWLTIQNGGPTPKPKSNAATKAAPPRYQITGRDLALNVQLGGLAVYGAFTNTMGILDALGAPLDKGNPYNTAKTLAGIATFGTGFHGLDLVVRVANAALKAVHYQKWLVHRRARPEAFGGYVHNHKTNAAAYPIHDDLVSTSAVLDAVFQKHGSYLLPMPVPRGCPMHPSYPAAHAVVNGACTTVLKAWFDESYALPNPVVPSADGSTLLPYKGGPLTVGGELNKQSGNLLAARSFAGFHPRSDLKAGLLLGEAVAISIMADERRTFHEDFKGFTLTTFDGTTITV